MSWQAYVDTNMVGTGKIKKGAIYGLQGGCWAQSKDFSVNDSEVAQLVKGFTDPNSVRATSPKVEGKKFIVVKVDDRSIYAKEGTNGLVCVKTNLAILVGWYDKTVQAGEANSVIEKLADYLIEQNC